MTALVALISLVAITNLCGLHKEMIDTLREQYQEVIVSIAVHRNGGIVEEVVNKETGSWTTLLTMPMQLTCIVAAGQGWRTVVPEKVPGEEDA